MFGLLHSEFVQSSALRTWNCVAHIANLLWHKFHHLRDPIMPRSRRRHHSRSRSRSRSHSHERDREPKRRKIDETHRRTVSSQPEATNDSENQTETLDEVASPITLSDNTDIEIQNEKEENNTSVFSDNTDPETANNSKEDKVKEDSNENKKQLNVSYDVDEDAPLENTTINYDCKVVLVDVGGDYTKSESEASPNSLDETIQLDSDDNDDDEYKSPSKSHTNRVEMEITPKKTGSPKQKKLESEKKRIERQKDKEEREMKRQKEKEEREMKKQKEKEEKNRVKEEKMKQKQEKDEQKQKEKMEKQEQRQKEKEMKEQKRREKEEKDEQKRKEKEQEKLKRQQEIDEKNREKAKIEEQKQKAAAVFVNFFLTKKADGNEEKIQRREEKFKPFEIKSEMRLAPIRRIEFTEESKSLLDQTLQNQDSETSYLKEIKLGKSIGKMKKTWPLEESIEDDVLVVEENTLGETIVEQKPKLEKMRAKFLKFHENQRPPYFGTWRKNSKFVRPRNPFGKDGTVLDYEVDSDDEWEDEGEGESLRGSDEDEKEIDSENEYEVDNEFFVPHGHLSDDEIDDEENAKLSPESHKTKLKLLKNEFEEEMKSKTQKIKPRLIGCIWYNKTQDNVEDAIHRYLQPFSIISNGQVQIVKRSNIISSTQKKTSSKQLEREHIPLFLKLIHGNVKKRKILINEFLEFLSNNGVQVDVSKIALGRQFKEFAQWMKCPEQGVMHNKMCWYVSEDVRKEFEVNVSLPNRWKSISKENSTLD